LVSYFFHRWILYLWIYCFSGQAIKSKLEIDCVADSSISELMRCIRGQLTNLMPNVDDEDMRVMSLGLGHSLSRYKLKFSPEKIDTMIVQVSTLFLTSVKYQAYPLWQYGLWIFQAGGTKLERFLHKNQHTQRKWLNFEFWINDQLSKIGHHFCNKNNLKIDFIQKCQ
jgi:hypothetical protein